MKHLVCKTELVVRPRVVQTIPYDKEWPRDVTLGLPYCTRCKTLVPLPEIMVEAEDVHQD